MSIESFFLKKKTAIFPMKKTFGVFFCFIEYDKPHETLYKGPHIVLTVIAQIIS